MEPGCADLTGAASKMHLLRINGYRATATMTQSEYIKSVWNVDGHEWEVRCYPQVRDFPDDWVELKLIFLVEAQTERRKVRATLSRRLVDPSGKLGPSDEKTVSKVFYYREDSSYPIRIVKTGDPKASAYLKNDSSTVRCTVTVLKELPAAVIPCSPAKEAPIPMPPSDLHQHLGELFLSQKGADVTFVMSGETFAAHKNILAVRSPVFIPEFFGHMKERHSC